MATSAREWKGRVQTEGVDLELPSGNVALVRQMSPTAFVQSGLIPDPLTGIIRQSIASKTGINPKTLQQISDDPAKISAAMEMFDRVLSFVVIEPPILMPPTCDVKVDGEPCGQYANVEVHQKPTSSGHHRYNEGPRDPEVLYADQVDMDDKMFIFQWCLGGTSDLTSFREEQKRTVESLSDRKTVQRKAKQPAGRR